MADNFLEKRMADYASGRLAAHIRKPYRFTTTDKNVPTALVTDGLTDEGQAMVEKLRNEGYKVTFLGRQLRQGNLLAQQTGTQYVHIKTTLEDAAARAEALRGRPFDLVIRTKD